MTSAAFAIVPSAVAPATCSGWLTHIDAAYRRIDVVPSCDFVPESSSFRLRAIAELTAIDVWSALSIEAREHCIGVVGSRPVIDVDQCWVRRQFAPGSAPPRHRPHSWHQDGALGFEFAPSRDAAIPHDALLRMVTCWIALTPCGVDAPGLDLVTDRIDRMLAPDLLADAVVEQQWPGSMRICPALEAGDVVVFGGGLLHRTHVSAAMTRARTSIELRCFASDAIPQRIAGDEFVPAPRSVANRSSSGEVG